MSKQLTVHNATITTASVEVKTLTISGKQVTLAVFKQLREEPVIGARANLIGEPWGYVNYHPNKCEGNDHLHVVWQRDSDLLRARVEAPWAAGLSHPAAGLFVEALIGEGLIYAEPNEYQVRPRPNPERPGEVVFTYKGVQFVGTIRPQFKRAYMAESGAGDLRALLAESLGGNWSSEYAAEQLPAAEYQKSWRLLNELPQLFIAV